MTDPVTPPVGTPGGTPTPPAPGSDPKPAAQPVTPPVGQPAAPAQPKPGEPGPAATTPAPATPPAGDPKAAPQTVPIAALLDERGKRQALETEIAQLRAAQPPSPIQQTMYPQQQPAAPQQPQTPQPGMTAEAMDKLWDSDPRQAVNQTFMAGIDWYDRVNNSIGHQADQLATKHPDFNTHRSAAERYVRALPVAQRGAPGVLEAAYFIVRGQNVDYIIQNHEAELMRKYQAGELATPPPAGAGQAPAAPQGGVMLTEEQRTVAGAMGLTEEQYVANMKAPVT